MTTAKKTTAKSAPTKPAAAVPAPKSSATKAAATPATAAVAKAAKPAGKQSAPAPKPVIRTAKAVKAKKVKRVSDKFVLPADELAALKDLKVRAAKLANPAKKSTLIRAGIKTLAAMADAAFLAAVNAVPARNAGRKKKGKKNKKD